MDALLSTPLILATEKAYTLAPIIGSAQKMQADVSQHRVCEDAVREAIASMG